MPIKNTINITTNKLKGNNENNNYIQQLTYRYFNNYFKSKCYNNEIMD